MNMAVAESQIAQALDIGPRAVRLRAVKGDWPMMKRPKQGGSELFFIRELLPVQVQERLVQRESALPMAVPVDAPVPKKSHRIGLAKFNLVRSFRLAKAQAPWGGKGDAARDFLLAYNAGVLLPQVFEVVGEIREKTIEALDKKLRNNDDNYLCLCDGRGGWKNGQGHTTGRQLSERAKAVFLKCYLHGSQPTVKMAIRAARMTLDRAGVQEAASDSTWRRWLKDYETLYAGVVCLARQGMKAYQDQFGPYISRDAGLLEVGQCLVADGKTLNFYIRHPETGRPCRMTLVVFFDWASRFPAGWQIMPTENQIAILAAFRNAVEALGRYPDMVYLDNGRAFKSKLFTDTDPDFEELTGLYARVGTGVTFAKPYNGRSKVVERFFKTVQDQLEWIVPSYCGDSIATKPPWMHRNETFQKAWHEARTRNWIPTIREAALIIDRYFSWYGQQPHQDLTAPPETLFLEGRGPGVDVLQLNHDFLMRKEVRPRNCRVTLWGIDYESDCLHNLSRNHPVLAMIDTANLDRIFCYTKDGIFLGEAYPVQACHPLAKHFGDQASLDHVIYQNKRQASLAKKTRQHLTALGVDKDARESLNILPFARQKSPVLPRPAKQATPPAETLTATEIKQLEAAVENAQAEIQAQPEIPRPPYWKTELAHYEWCFEVVFKHGRDLDPPDAAFMDRFETLPEFDQYRQRFDDLKELYSEKEVKA